MTPQTGPNPPAYPAAQPAAARWWVCYALFGAVLIYALAVRWCYPLVLSEPIGVQDSPASFAISDAPDGSDPHSGTQNPLSGDANLIDPNLAGWPELMRLPGIGEVTAKRIVEYREQHDQGSGLPVFNSAEDMARVRGIGPKTVEAIKPFLTFAREASADPPAP